MQHGPMNPIVAIASSLISAFYVQTISLLVILFALHTFSGTVTFHNWKAALCGLLIVGLMAEFFTTKRASMLWDMER